MQNIESMAWLMFERGKGARVEKKTREKWVTSYS